MLFEIYDKEQYLCSVDVEDEDKAYEKAYELFPNKYGEILVVVEPDIPESIKTLLRIRRFRK